jgi:hypothetical protein
MKLSPTPSSAFKIRFDLEMGQPNNINNITNTTNMHEWKQNKPRGLKQQVDDETMNEKNV